MEILLAVVVAFILFCIFKRSSSYKKSEAATVVQKLLEPVHQFGMFTRNPAEAARDYVQDVWDDKSSPVEDGSGNQPDAVPVAAYALALAAKRLFECKDNNAYPVSIALGKALSGIQTHGGGFREGKLNAHFIGAAEQIYATIVRPAIAEDTPAMRQLTEQAAASTHPRKVESNPAEGVFQMPEFPYATYEAWLDVYRRSASEATEALKIQTSDKGREWSLIDLMDDAPLRSAFAHHLDPMPLGTHFGKTFDITKMQM